MQSKNYVTANNCVISKQKYMAYTKKWPQLVILLYNLYIFLGYNTFGVHL